MPVYSTQLAIGVAGVPPGPSFGPFAQTVVIRDVELLTADQVAPDFFVITDGEENFRLAVPLPLPAAGALSNASWAGRVVLPPGSEFTANTYLGTFAAFCISGYLLS